MTVDTSIAAIGAVRPGVDEGAVHDFAVRGRIIRHEPREFREIAERHLRLLGERMADAHNDDGARCAPTPRRRLPAARCCSVATKPRNRVPRRAATGLSSDENATRNFNFNPGCAAINCCATAPIMSAIVGMTPTTIVPRVMPRIASISATARRILAVDHLGVTKKCLPIRRRRYAARLPVEQRNAQLIFEIGDRLAERRLRHIHGARGRMHRTVLDTSNEISEQPQIHERRAFRLRGESLIAESQRGQWNR